MMLEYLYDGKRKVRRELLEAIYTIAYLEHGHRSLEKYYGDNGASGIASGCLSPI